MLERIRAFLKSESAKLEGKTLRQKVEYVRDYYWLQITLVVVLVSVSSFVAYRAATTLKEHWFYLTIANTREEAGNGSPLWEGYVEYSGYDLSQKMIDFNDDSYFDYGKNHAAGNQYYEMFVGLTDAGVMDAVTMEPDSLCSLGESGRLLDLRSDQCASIREQYSERFLYAIPYDTEYSTDPVPIGIDVTDSILMTQYHLYVDGCALGICAQSSNIEAVEKFLEYIFTVKAPAMRPDTAQARLQRGPDISPGHMYEQKRHAPQSKRADLRIQVAGLRECGQSRTEQSEELLLPGEAGKPRHGDLMRKPRTHLNKTMRSREDKRHAGADEQFSEQ